MDTNSWLIVGVLVILFMSGLRTKLTHDTWRDVRIARLETKLDMLLKHHNIEWHDESIDEVKRLIAAGEKIPAIKLYRESTGTGLAEAKKAVEAMQLEPSQGS